MVAILLLTYMFVVMRSILISEHMQKESYLSDHRTIKKPVHNK